MRKITHSKRGFTLLEMMLSIAIITIISGCLYTLVVAIKDSYMNTYNTDDSLDYAMLYARAFENDFLARTQEEGSFNANDTITWYSGVESGVASLYRKVVTGTTTTTTPIFTMAMNQVNDGAGSLKDKWVIEMEYTTSGGMVNYTIKVYDNYYRPSKDITRCVYSGGFWIPHCNNGSVSVASDNKDITFKFS